MYKVPFNDNNNTTLAICVQGYIDINYSYAITNAILVDIFKMIINILFVHFFHKIVDCIDL